MDLRLNESTALPAPDLVFQMFATIYRAAIFRAALELQIWAKLAARPRTSDALAAAPPKNQIVPS